MPSHAKDGRVLYLTEAKDQNYYWNIPIANTTVILLGTGTSITQAAVRMLASAGVLVGFCGGGGTPLFSGSEIEWLNPQNEYRPTSMFRAGSVSGLMTANVLLSLKLSTRSPRLYPKTWNKDRDLKAESFFIDDALIANALSNYSCGIDSAEKSGDLLQREALMTKHLYRYAAKLTQQADFTRDHQSTDIANDFLNHGNYLAYGLAATTLWVLGIPHGFAVMHGKTRRGALVFDVADLIKDAIVLPWAFICAKEK